MTGHKIKKMTGNELIEGIVKITTALTPFALAWIAYKQVKINKKQDAIHKEMNGMKEALIVAKKSEGHEEGMAQQKADSASTASETVQAIKDDPDIDITKTK